MPKDEFDFEDPLELNGVGIVCAEDTTEAMTECFVEEFMRLGHNHKQILALFRNPHYLGMNMALQNRGEAFVRDKISEVFTRWGKPVAWPETNTHPLTPALSPSEGERVNCRLSMSGSSSGDIRKSFEESDEVGIHGGGALLSPLPLGGGEGQGEGVAGGQTIELDSTTTDPMGVPVPKLIL